jgi:hypothetical protein
MVYLHQEFMLGGLDKVRGEIRKGHRMLFNLAGKAASDGPAL